MPEIRKPSPPGENEYNQDGDIRALGRPSHRLQVELPAEPPQLSPQAAKALLDLLLKARPRRTAVRSKEV